jgi:DNA-binding CsgD family transcriptional regulator
MEKNIGQQDSVVTSFYENTPALQPITTNNNCVIEIDDFSDMCIEAMYVIDFPNQCFHSISDNDLFLCGYSKDEAMLLGYDFYSEVVHKNDLPRLIEMHQEILNCLCNPDNMSEINYFSCTFRIKNYLQKEQKTEYLMVYQKLIPKFIDGKILYGICLLTSSVIKNTGNLRLYYKDNRRIDIYSFGKKRWTECEAEHLTKQETKILIYAKQGMTLKMIAYTLGIAYKTVQKITETIYEKLNVHTMEEAIIYATNHLLLFHSHKHKIHKHKLRRKKCRIKLHPEVLQRIQTDMDIGQSINSIAKRENVSNSAIHKAIKSGKLNKNTQSIIITKI